MSRLKLLALACLCWNAVAAEPARILTSEKMPFNYMEHEQISGISVDVLQLLFEQKLPVPVEMMPWPRVYATALASFADIRKHRLVVAGLRAGWLSEQFKAAGIQIETVGSYQQGMDMLLKKRAQLWLSTDLEEQVLQARHPDAPSLAVVRRLMCSENYFGLSPGSDPALFAHLQKKYQQLSSSKQLMAVQQKWQSRLKLPLAYTPATGFYLQDADLLRCEPSSEAG